MAECYGLIATTRADGKLDCDKLRHSGAESHPRRTATILVLHLTFDSGPAQKQSAVSSGLALSGGHKTECRGKKAAGTNVTPPRRERLSRFGCGALVFCGPGAACRLK